MTYFLDFDRTLFDTDAFIQTLPKRTELVSLRNRLLQVTEEKRDGSVSGQVGRYELWEEVGKLLSLKKGELSQFLYPDAKEFLLAHGRESIIVTYGSRALLSQKIESALNGIAIERIVHTDDKEKGVFLKELVTTYTSPHIAIDDLVSQLDSIVKESPEVTCYEMRRDGQDGSGRYPVIRSLSELPQ